MAGWVLHPACVVRHAPSKDFGAAHHERWHLYRKTGGSQTPPLRRIGSPRGCVVTGGAVGRRLGGGWGLQREGGLGNEVPRGWADGD